MTPERIFLSYRRADTRHIAGRLFDRLADSYGEDAIFMDVDSIEPGLDFGDVIDRAVGECDVLIALIGPTWLSETDRQGNWRLGDPNDTVVLEIKAALDRDIRLIPVLVDGAIMPQLGDLPPSIGLLARRNSVRVDHETFKRDVEPLLDVLAKMMDGPRDGRGRERKMKNQLPYRARDDKLSLQQVSSNQSAPQLNERPGLSLWWGGGSLAISAAFLLVGFMFDISKLWIAGIMLAMIGVGLMLIGFIWPKS